MNSKKCGACQAEMDDDAIFCNECGLASVSNSVVGVQSDPIFGSAAAAISEPVPPPGSPQPRANVAQASSSGSTLGKTCARCGKSALDAERDCSGCAFDMSVPFVEAKPAISRDGTPVTRSIVNSVRKRYREGYRTSKIINGFGIFFKIVGYVVGGLSVIAGLVGAGKVGEYSGDVAALTFLYFLGVGALWTFVFWLIGVFVMGSAQKLKASLDGAVHSSPFITDLDRAEIMSLTGQLSGFENRGVYDSPELSDSGWFEEKADKSIQTGSLVRKTLGSLKPNKAALLCYVSPIMLPILASIVMIFLSSLLGELGLVLGGLMVMAAPFVLQFILLKTPSHQSGYFVRFHALQSLLLVGVQFVVIFVSIGILYIRGAFFSLAGPVPGTLGLVFLLVFLFMCVKANNNDTFKLPLIGDWAENFAVTKTSVSGTSIR